MIVPSNKIWINKSKDDDIDFTDSTACGPTHFLSCSNSYLPQFLQFLFLLKYDFILHLSILC
jgi:hypothetical protein